jgi:hydroxymethylbilane synthase
VARTIAAAERSGCATSTAARTTSEFAGSTVAEMKAARARAARLVSPVQSIALPVYQSVCSTLTDSMSAPAVVRIATRESQLALAQTRLVAEALAAARPGLRVELVPMTTRGDRVLDRPLAQVGGKGLFVKELEAAMDAGRADLAVHSLKDVPMVLPPQFALATFGARESPYDAFVSNRFESLAALPAGARVGTSSLRREAQLRHAYPALDVCALRGNVNTRLAKLDAGDYDAIVLAAAGLRRLGLGARVRTLLDDAIPAIGQGILALEHALARADLARLIAPLEDPATAAAARAERAVGLVVEGSCEVPVGAHARVAGEAIEIEAFVGLPDGTSLVRVRQAGAAADAEALGRALGRRLLDGGGREVLERLGASAGRGRGA